MTSNPLQPRDSAFQDLAFAGGGLERAAHLRKPAAQPALLADPQARVLPLWRGMPLVAGAEAAVGSLAAPQLAWLPLDHPILAGAPAPLFLGLAPGHAAPDTAGQNSIGQNSIGQGAFARYCLDLSAWQPPPQKDADGPAASPVFDPAQPRHPGLPDDHRFADLRGLMMALTPFEAEAAATARALIGWHQSHGFCAACGQASGVAMAGWQRDCPACGAHHFPRTDPVVIMLVTAGNQLLLGRSPGWPEGMYSCLAGFMEPGETLEAAVAREVAEETGITVTAVRFIASQPWPFPASLMLGCEARARLPLDPLRIDPEEIEAATWISREDLALVFAGQHPQIRPPRRGAIAGHLMRLWLADALPGGDNRG